MKPEYVAKKSAWECISFLWILSCILIIPIFIIAYRIFAIKQFSIEFYQDKIIIKKGLLNKTKKQMVFMGVTSVSTERSLWGQLFNYGNVVVDCVGKWDVNFTTYIKNPEALEAYLQSRIVQAPMGGQGGSPFVMM